jgi:hypothetical protein
VDVPEVDPAADLFSQLRASIVAEGGGRRRLDVRRVGTVGAAALAVACVVVGASWLRPVDTAGAPRAVEVPDPVPGSSTTVAVGDVGRVWPDEPVEIRGNEVTVGDRRWSVGEPGDLVALGDWDCDGTRTPAVLRPSLAQLFVFDQWAEDGEVTAVAGPSAPDDAVELAADGCGRAFVTTRAGDRVAVETTAGER